MSSSESIRKDNKYFALRVKYAHCTRDLSVHKLSLFDDGPHMCGIFVSASYSNQNHDTEESQKQFNHVCSQLRMANALRGKLNTFLS